MISTLTVERKGICLLLLMIIRRQNKENKRQTFLHMLNLSILSRILYIPSIKDLKVLTKDLKQLIISPMIILTSLVCNLKPDP